MSIFKTLSEIISDNVVITADQISNLPIMGKGCPIDLKINRAKGFHSEMPDIPLSMALELLSDSIPKDQTFNVIENSKFEICLTHCGDDASGLRSSIESISIKSRFLLQKASRQPISQF